MCIDYGPDNSSAPEDIAETAELESLRSMREEVQHLVAEYLKSDGTVFESTRFAMNIDKAVNPDEVATNARSDNW